MTRRKVLVTGASGLIGGLALKQLGDRYEFSGLSRRPVAGIPHLSADITDAAAIQPAFSGIHTVLHLAAANGADQWLEWAPTMAITVQGTLNVYEAAQSRRATGRVLQQRLLPARLGMGLELSLRNTRERPR